MDQSPAGIFRRHRRKNNKGMILKNRYDDMHYIRFVAEMRSTQVHNKAWAYMRNINWIAEIREDAFYTIVDNLEV